jgi:hypothetical protein
MVFNFRARGISRDAGKLIQISMLIKKKLIICVDPNQVFQYIGNINNLGRICISIEIPSAHSMQ